jgi:uncharacterized membrane protein YphA (DoxX/SURF4 family)
MTANRRYHLQTLRGWVLSPWPNRLVRWVLGLIFIYAGGSKLLAPKAFARMISGYDLLPEPLLPVVAIGLPTLELLAGAGLVFKIRGSLPIISGLLLLFIAVLGYGIWQDLDVDCGCFTPEELAQKDGLKRAFYRDLAMMGAVLFLFWSQRLKFTKRPSS